MRILESYFKASNFRASISQCTNVLYCCEILLLRDIVISAAETLYEKSTLTTVPIHTTNDSGPSLRGNYMVSFSSYVIITPTYDDDLHVCGGLGVHIMNYYRRPRKQS